MSTLADTARQRSTLRLAGRAAAIPPSATATLDARAKELIAGGLDVINLTSGEPAFATVEPAARAGVSAIQDDFTRYTPAAGIPELRAAVANRLRRHGAAYTSGDVVITAGAKQALHYAFTALLQPGDEVLIPAPHWVSYPHMVKLAGGVPVVLAPGQGDGLRLTPAAVRAGASRRSRLLLINNPSNPSGVVYSRKELADLAEAALESGIALISDEICDHWVYGDTEFVSLASLSAEIAANTVTIGGVSKTYAMTGWRIGWTATPQPIANSISAIQSHTASAPSSISQKAALGALQDADLEPELRRRREELAARRYSTLSALAAVPGIEVDGNPEGAFFVFADVSGTYGLRTAGRTIRSAADFAELLLSEVNVAVVPGADFGAPHHVRISYTVPPDRLRTALTRIAVFRKSLQQADQGEPRG
jgi:aspartate aminotransferase